MTSDSKRLLYKMFSEYKSRRKKGINRQNALCFGSYEQIAPLLPDDLPEDVDEYLRELSRLGYIKAFYADDHVYDCCLTTEAVEKMENLPLDTFQSVLDFISKFIP